MRRFIFPEYHGEITVENDGDECAIVHVDAVHDAADKFLPRLGGIADLGTAIPVCLEVLEQVSGFDQVSGCTLAFLRGKVFYS